MRHGKKFNHLGRKAPHRKAMLANMATSLIENKRISTTVAKAKELRKYVEPLITKAKDDTTHSRRTVFSYLQDKETVSILFNQVAQKVAERPGGYTRIIKLGQRLGDNAEMCMIELVDYNDLLLKDESTTKSKTRRKRSGKKSSDDATEGTEAKAAPAKEAKAEPKAEEDKAETKTEAKAEDTAAIAPESGDKLPETDEPINSGEEKTDDKEEKKDDK